MNLIVISVLCWLSLSAVRCHVYHNKRKDELSEFSLPSCGITTPATIPNNKRRRIAFISHESAIATFFHNPEQGSRDAANIVNVDIEWNRYLTRSESKMAQDIRNAVNSASDDMTLTLASMLTATSIPGHRWHYCIDTQRQRIPGRSVCSGQTCACHCV